VIHFIRDNLKVVSWVLTVAIVLFIIVIGVSRVHAYRAGKATGALYAAQRLQAGSADQQKALEEVADDYSSTPAGRQAMLLSGDILMARGDFTAAQAQFENLAKNSKGNNLLKIAAMHKEAAAERAMGKLEDAAKTYLAAAEDPRNLNKEDSFYQAARCYEELKQYAEAAKFYKKVIESAQESGTKLKSEERLLWLIANGSISG